jgi:hypothetical protein
MVMHLPQNLVSFKFLPAATNTTLLLPNPMATRKETRLSNPSKKKTGQAKYPGFPKAKGDCKKTAQLA